MELQDIRLAWICDLFPWIQTPPHQRVLMPDIQPTRDNMAYVRMALLMDGYLETADSGWKLINNGFMPLN
jgi:hypothetical protein